MNSNIFYSIFKKYSRTYFYSSLFFPTDIRLDVFILYSFVRTADNFVDNQPQQKKEFYAFKDSYHKAIKGKVTHDIIIDSFVELAYRKNFNLQWVDAFLSSMEQDFSTKYYKTFKETCTYMYGSAEVIGLMMARILDLPEQSLPYAQMLGKAMQYVNFIRDISEDLDLGRIYFPKSELNKFGLKTLTYEEVSANPEAFKTFIHQQITTYYQWQSEAEKGFAYIPRRYLIPIKTASDMYKWTAVQIHKQPMRIYQHKIKPSSIRVVSSVLANSIISS